MVLLIGTLAIYFCAEIIAALGFNLQFGMMGIINLSFVASQAAGAYISSVLRLGPSQGYVQQYVFGAHVPFPLDLLAGAAAGALLSTLIAVFFITRLRPELFVTVTVVIAADLVALVGDLNTLFNGAGGLFDVPAPIVHTATPNSTQEWVLIAIAVGEAALVFWISRNIEISPISRRLRAARDNQMSAKSIGVKVGFYQVTMMGLGGAFAGLSGGLLILASGAWGTSAWQVVEVVVVLAAVVLGGSGNIWGVAFGVFLLQMLLGEGLLYIPAISNNPTISANFLPVITSIVGIAMFWKRPKGAIPERVRAFEREEQIHEVDNPQAIVDFRSATHDGRMVHFSSFNQGAKHVLEIRGISASYGASPVLKGVSFIAQPGVTCIVGPNGAGKSTLIDVISGFRATTSGMILLDGDPIVGSPTDRVSRGIARTFQLPQEFGSMTVFENVAVAVGTGKESSVARALAGKWSWDSYERDVSRRVWPILEMCGLVEKANDQAKALSGGQKKLLELARALGKRPAVLLLDEPMAGVAPHLRDSLLEVLEELRDMGLTLLVVEHNLDTVQRLSSHVIVMNFGEVLADGDFVTVRERRDVQEAFLGVTEIG